MHYLVSRIIDLLELELATAVEASKQAHDSATHSENIASSRYDTLAIEAGYMAHGQSMRIADLQNAIALYKEFKPASFTAQSAIQLGATIELSNEDNQAQHLFLGPAAGGLKINRDQGAEPNSIQVLTPTTPLGKALMNKRVGDEIQLKNLPNTPILTITSIQ